MSRGKIKHFKECFPFSVGKRNCPGEGLAKMELFIYLASLCQRFKVIPRDPDNVPEVKACLNVTRCPEPYEARCVDRRSLWSATCDFVRYLTGFLCEINNGRPSWTITTCGVFDWFLYIFSQINKYVTLKLWVLQPYKFLVRFRILKLHNVCAKIFRMAAKFQLEDMDHIVNYFGRLSIKQRYQL